MCSVLCGDLNCSAWGCIRACISRALSVRPQTCSAPCPLPPASRVQIGCLHLRPFPSLPRCLQPLLSRRRASTIPAAETDGPCLSRARRPPGLAPCPSSLHSAGSCVLFMLPCHLSPAVLGPHPRASLGEAESSAPATRSLRPALLLPVSLHGHASAALCGALGPSNPGPDLVFNLGPRISL